MPHLSADTKHHILLEYSPHDPTRSFVALARRHAVKGGERLLRLWHSRWDGTPASLQRKAGSGKQPLLSSAQVSRHIRAPMLAANRAHRAFHYTQVLPKVRQATGTEVSLRTVQRMGHNQLQAKNRRGVKRTAQESK
jgi:hypothetical protein